MAPSLLGLAADFGHYLGLLADRDVAPWESELYVVSYRPVHSAEHLSLDMWPSSVQVETALPTVPLW